MDTLRGRIALVTTLVVALAFVLTGLVIVGATARSQEQRLERDLTDRLQLLVDAGRDQGRPPRPGAGLGDEVLGDLRRTAERTLGPGIFLAVVRGNQVLVTLGDAPASLPVAPATGEAQRFTDSNGRDYLIRAAPANGRPPRSVTYVIGADTDRLLGEQQRALRNRFVLIGLLATLLTGVATFVIAGLAARPLGRLRAATEGVAATEDLTTRVDVGSAPAEIASVAEGLNTMLARLERSRAAREAALHAAQRFAADAGHELRTPLTAMQSTLDTLRRNPGMDADLQAELVAEVGQESRRLAGLLESLQTLARADAGLMRDVEPVELGDVVGAAIDSLRGRHPGLTVHSVIPEDPVLVNGAEPWLRSIVDNLLRNAALHGRPDGVVAVGLDVSEPGWTFLTVDDDGPGIPADLRQEVFGRFTRGVDASARPGSGLGLSLVAQLTALHGGAVRIDDAPLGGARVQVRLPRLMGP